MNEPKKTEIEAAAKKLWPNLESICINQRKHTLRITFPLVVKDGRRVRPPERSIAATSHRELLNILKASQPVKAGTP